MFLNTLLYAALHFWVDFVCAWAMFSFYIEGNYENLLIYNFCAFALQMPFGTLLDLLKDRMRRLPATVAAFGAIITVVASLISPAILGVGNALFHVGGGVDVMEEDLVTHKKGKNLGLFVAPGAIGVYVGTLLSRDIQNMTLLICSALCMIVLLYLLLRFGNEPGRPEQDAETPERRIAIPVLCCFLVVVLRSWVGLAVSFHWKAVASFATLAVFAAAGGKFCGGLLAARFGIRSTAAVSLLLAAVCYLMADVPMFGIGAVFLFNMSMPLTLLLVGNILPHLTGFSFGLLTFGLFLGFLPVYAQVQVPIAGTIMGALGSVISCILLMIGGGTAKYDEIPA